MEGAAISARGLTAVAGAAGEMNSVLGIAQRTDLCSNAALASAEDVGRTADTLQSKVSDFLSAMSIGSDETFNGEMLTAAAA